MRSKQWISFVTAMVLLLCAAGTSLAGGLFPSANEVFGDYVVSVPAILGREADSDTTNEGSRTLVFRNFTSEEYEKLNLGLAGDGCTLVSSVPNAEGAAFTVESAGHQIAFVYDTYNYPAAALKVVYPSDVRLKEEAAAGTVGILPALDDMLGNVMPTLRKILMRNPDAVSKLEDGGTQVTFLNVTEEEFDRYSAYLSEFGCTLAGYSVEGTVIAASVERNGHIFTFTYDYSDGTAVISYPSDTKEEDFDVAACEEAIDAFKQVGNYVTFGTYPQGANGEVEPIEWLVLDVQGDKVLLISRYGLDAQPYNTKYTDVTWETCTLRNWLNSTFLNKAFTAEEQTAILTTNVDNSSSQCYSGWNTKGGNNTQDKIFLLSYAEARQYFGVEHYSVSGAKDNMQSRTSPTAYAIAQGAWTSSSYKTSEGQATCWWWLRSPGSSSSSAATVHGSGALDRSSVGRGYDAVRPALWLDLSSGIF